ncbi:glycosyltransferase family 9 protein [Candidatus Pelagibacter sp. HIMB1485]|uniref:glycosyltransferase family 9 protein n=1 Tax=Candidatus Pelagibacter sp. HIMB1485 TaxID=3415415 RepID=UPI003F82BF6B
MDGLKTLIFRTDRIGDFIISCPFILSYKNKNPKNKLLIVSSEYNYNYIKNFNFIDKIIPLKNENKFFPKLLILIQIILLLKKEKYRDVIILDGKNRSFFISLFLKGRKSIFTDSRGIEFFSKIFRYIYVSNYQIQNQLKNFSFLASRNDFNIDIKKIDLYKNYLFHKNYDFNNKYISIHLDEKWYTRFYYRDFTDINPNSKQIEEFISKIFEKSEYQYDIVITSGAKHLEELNNYVSSFKSINSNISEKYMNNKVIRFIKKTSFNDLENIVKNSSFLITCEGGISHASHNLKVKTLAFYQKNRLEHIKFWTGHMEHMTIYERKNMNELLKDKNFFNLFQNKLLN